MFSKWFILCRDDYVPSLLETLYLLWRIVMHPSWWKRNLPKIKGKELKLYTFRNVLCQCGGVWSCGSVPETAEPTALFSFQLQSFGLLWPFSQEGSKSNTFFPSVILALICKLLRVGGCSVSHPRQHLLHLSHETEIEHKDPWLCFIILYW